MCRSRRELSNEYLLAKFGFDTAENEPCKVCPLSVYRSPRCLEDYNKEVRRAAMRCLAVAPTYHFANEVLWAMRENDPEMVTSGLAFFQGIGTRANEQMMKFTARLRRRMNK